MQDKQPPQAPFAPGQSHSVDAQFAESLLSEAMSAGADYADIYFEYSSSAHLSLEQQKVKGAGRGLSMGLGVRATRGDATGYAYTEKMDSDAMKKVARTAAQIAQSGKSQTAPPVALENLPNRYPIEQLSLVEDDHFKKQLLERADKAARAYDPRIKEVQASFAEAYKEVLIATSDGAFVRDIRPMIRMSVSVIAEDGQEKQSGTAGGGGRYGLDYFLQHGHKPEDHGREAARVAVAMLGAKEAPAGEFPVILAPGDSGILLHEAVGHGLEADFNRKGTSNYTGRIGKSVASDLVTVTDDPRLPGGRGSVNVDDEGRIAEPVTLIENGTLTHYLQDKKSAQHFGVSSSHGRRQDFRSSPMPRMTNTLMLAGPHDPEEIIRDTQYGVFARKFSGGQVNISNGDFVFSLTEGYLVENGRITAPLKGVNLIGNGPEAMTRIDRLGTDLEVSDGIWTCGKDGQSVPVGVGCPTIRISNMTVGGTKVG